MRHSERRPGVLAGLALAALALAGCATAPTDLERQAAREGYTEVSDLYIVDCLLPGQIRKLGNMTYQTPRRPIRTTAADCRIRGGEYVAYDRADYRSALKVWLERAEAGDPEAQNYVGEIFEKGLGRQPDYLSAAQWYRKAAEQGYSRAQINLGYLYETGLGVERDVAAALNWYRKASGLSDDQLVYESELNQAVEELRAELQTKLDRADRQVAVLESQLQGMKAERAKLEKRLSEMLAERSDTSSTPVVILGMPQMEGGSSSGDEAPRERPSARRLQQAADQADRAAREAQQRADRLSSQQQAAEARAAAAEAERLAAEAERANAMAELAAALEEMETLEELYARAQSEREELSEELSSLRQQRTIASSMEPQRPSVDLPAQDPREFQDIRFGRYYALIIGNKDYAFLDDLRSPLSDARRIKELLETRYGFSAVLIADADDQTMLNAVNDLFEQLRPEDNLLIYYAGHGYLSERAGGQRLRGYWLPVNAEPDRFTHWVNNSVISDHLDRIKARSVLVIADSCYAGAMADESSALLLGSAQAGLSEASIRDGLARRSRMVISSGGLKPVLDTLDGRHSLFAKSFIEVLESNDQVLRDNMLFARVAVTVRRRAEVIGVDQTPEMRPIRAAGHEGGDFYLVPNAGPGGVALN